MRFIPLIDRISIDDRGCWNWKGGTVNGYGYATYKGRRVLAHRVSAILWLGLNENDPRYVLHNCDNHSCFNPKHLFIGTQLDNIRDAKVKGRLRNQNSYKTHCIKGHHLAGENLYLHAEDGKVHRRCKECQKENDKRFKLKRRSL